MKRGEVWTIAGAGGYAGKPRPVLIVQDDVFDGTESVTVCAFITDPADAPLFRVAIAPTSQNGLREPSRLMVDKLTTTHSSKLGARIGRVDEADMLRFNRAAILFLGLLGSGA